ENDLVGHLRVDVGDLSDPFKTLTSSTPDFASKITQMNLESVFDSVADGWDGVIHLLRDALRSKLAANKIPLVGAQIQHALDFLQDLDQRVQAELMKAPHLAPQVVQKALIDALGAKGIGWLKKDVTIDKQTSDEVHFDVELHKQLLNVGGNLGVNLGLDGLGLKVDGQASLTSDVDADLSFGVSKNAGFYLDAKDNVDVNFKAKVDGQATGKLGFLQLDVKPSDSKPQVSGDLKLNLQELHANDKNLAGKVLLGEVPRAVHADLSAGADVKLGLEASLGGNKDLPHIDTGFFFHWSTAANDPTRVGFTDVKLDLGGFIDGIAHHVSEVLQPIK